MSSKVSLSEKVIKSAASKSLKTSKACDNGRAVAPANAGKPGNRPASSGHAAPVQSKLSSYYDTTIEISNRPSTERIFIPRPLSSGAVVLEYKMPESPTRHGVETKRGVDIALHRELFETLPVKPVIPLRISAEDILGRGSLEGSIELQTLLTRSVEVSSKLTKTAMKPIVEQGKMRNGKHTVPIVERARRVYEQPIMPEPEPGTQADKIRQYQNQLLSGITTKAGPGSRAGTAPAPSKGDTTANSRPGTGTGAKERREASGMDDCLTADGRQLYNPPIALHEMCAAGMMLEGMDEQFQLPDISSFGKNESVDVSKSTEYDEMNLGATVRRTLAKEGVQEKTRAVSKYSLFAENNRYMFSDLERIVSKENDDDSDVFRNLVDTGDVFGSVDYESIGQEGGVFLELDSVESASGAVPEFYFYGNDANSNGRQRSVLGISQDVTEVSSDNDKLHSSSPETFSTVRFNIKGVLRRFIHAYI